MFRTIRCACNACLIRMDKLHSFSRLFALSAQPAKRNARSFEFLISTSLGKTTSAGSGGSRLCPTVGSFLDVDTTAARFESDVGW